MVHDPYAALEPEMGPPLPRVVFAGPHTCPSASWSPGDVHALTVSFLPEAWYRLPGVQTGSYFDKVLPLEDVLEGPLLAQFLAIEPNPQGDTFQDIEQALQTYWTAVGGLSLVPTIHGWITSLMQRTALSNVGIGVRQLQRKLKMMAGQSQRELQIYARTERAMMCLAGVPENSPVELAGLAAAAGFSDQSHMGREIRRVSGLSPGRLEALMRADEAFWFYRLVRGGFQEHSNNIEPLLNNMPAPSPARTERPCGLAESPCLQCNRARDACCCVRR